MHANDEITSKRKDIVAVATAKIAGPVETLQGSGPFIIFALANEAFSKYPGGVIEDLIKLENNVKLFPILTIHVIDTVVLPT